jgi:hypothetical protein
MIPRDHESLFKILVADASTERTNRFSIRAAGKPFWLSIVKDEPALENSFKATSWDVLFISLYLGATKHMNTIPVLLEAYEAKKLKAVICYSPVPNQAREYMTALKRLGIPARWYPYNYNDPGKHEAVEL